MMRKKAPTWILALALSAIAIFIIVAIVVVVGDNIPSATTCSPNSYNQVKPRVQNAVTAYMIEHWGELPPTEGVDTALNISVSSGRIVQDCQILDICSLVNESEEDLLSEVPWCCMGSPGYAGTNFYTGNCERSTAEKAHYVFCVDPLGNVYTACDVNEDGVIDEDGNENCDCPGGCSGDYDTFWP